ncbi:hypothetical protein [Sulfitobacter sp. S190]|uniref:hypothetical protein n=1 Tax=Sulfitobacter sp. S190 TaxID=2867022 RepID=UPI0021A654A8|nr:hypothetical protein [Sulfitobacter sp. S190]UWR21056.1 hypothetical protein K3756_10010 [Sulfitobacter sp. S190]
MRAETGRRAVMLGALAMMTGCGVRARVLPRTSFTGTGNRLLMSGRITARTADDFATILAQNPQITEIFVQDMGGRHDVAAAIAMGMRVRAGGLSTHLQSDSRVAGAAIAPFLGGVTREAVAGAQIVPVGWDDPALAAFAARMAGPATQSAFGLRNAGADRIHALSETEVSQSGLLTAPLRPLNTEGRTDV